MPKMKTRKGVAKRFRVTGKGRVKRARAFRSHLLTGKSRKRRRNLGKPDYLSQADEKRIKVWLPNG